MEPERVLAAQDRLFALVSGFPPAPTSQDWHDLREAAALFLARTNTYPLGPRQREVALAALLADFGLCVPEREKRR